VLLDGRIGPRRLGAAGPALGDVEVLLDDRDGKRRRSGIGVATTRRTGAGSVMVSGRNVNAAGSTR
jgi:hypothetical protein